MSYICFGGSRGLTVAWSGFVSDVVSLLAPGGVSVGCARGADELVLSAALAARVPLRVAAVGDSSGAGFWSGSAPLPLLRAAAAAPGCSVSWLAGGGLRVPLRARLMSRSSFALLGCSSFVLFLAAPDSRGSLAVAGVAAGRGVPVFAFSCGFAGAPAAPRGAAGRWFPCELAGRAAWRWCPAGDQLPLF